MEIPSPQLLPPTQKHKLTTTFAPSIFTQEEFEIYKTYQIAIHQDLPEDVTEKGYTRFLCNTPLMDITKPRNNKPFNGYGSFHLQYRIDGKLIGVSVVDVLEKGMSSVYFFYLPEYSHLSLGVYSALYEIDLIAKEKEKCPEFTYYYLGYYIHR
jgi:arginine-tRNA-protein transferase